AQPDLFRASHAQRSAAERRRTESAAARGSSAAGVSSTPGRSAAQAARSRALARDPDLLARPLPRPLDGHAVVVALLLRPVRRVEVDQILHADVVRARKADATAVLQMEPDRVARDRQLEAVHPTLRPLERLHRLAHVWEAEHHEHQVAQKDEPTAWPEQPR